MKLGAERKQVAILGGILCIGLYFYLTSGPDIPSDPKGQQAKRAATAMPAPSSVRQPASKAVAAKRGSSSLQDFKPSLKPPKEGLDPATVDPSLRSDLLAKVQRVNLAGGNRSLFDFGQAPIAKEPTPPKIIPRNPLMDAVNASLTGPTTPAIPIPPAAPPKTPIPLKYYGFQGGPRQASKRAFFLEGDEIRIASEGELIGKRYKVVRIGLTSAVLEDTQQSYEQTLPLEEVQQGS